MININENPNLDIVKKVLTDNSVWDGSSEDGQSIQDFNPIESDRIKYLWIEYNKNTIGVFVLFTESSSAIQAHIAILKGFRFLAMKCVMALFCFFLELPDCFQKLNAQIPSYNNGCIRLALASGFKQEGVNRMSIKKNGSLHDQIILGLTRTEINQICHQY